MVARILMIMLSFLPFVGNLEAGVIERFFLQSSKQDVKTIKILVAHDKEGALVEVKGKYKLYNPFSNGHISTRFIGKRKFVQPMKDGIKWGEEFPGLHQLLIVPDDQSTTTLVDGIEYRGSLYIYDIGGGISIVNEVDIEDYISSMLASQVRENLPDELLAAVAIAARTDALYKSENPKNKYWAVDAKAVGYQGSAIVHPLSPTEHAICATKGMVMSQAVDNTKAVTPFPAQWISVGNEQGVPAKITIAEGESLAKSGAHAAQILAKAFPGISIQLIQR